MNKSYDTSSHNPLGSSRVSNLKEFLPTPVTADDGDEARSDVDVVGDQFHDGSVGSTLLGRLTHPHPQHSLTGINRVLIFDAVFVGSGGDDRENSVHR